MITVLRIPTLDHSTIRAMLALCTPPATRPPVSVGRVHIILTIVIIIITTTATIAVAST